MNRRRTALLILVASAASCGGGQTIVEEADSELTALEDAIIEVVENEARAQRLVGKVEEIKILSQESHDLRDVFLADIVTLNRDYDAPREAFVERFARYDAERERIRARFYPLRAALVADTTTAEWNALQDATDRALEALARVGAHGVAADEPEQER